MHPISLANDVDFDENVVSVLGSQELSLSIALPSSSFVPMAVLKPRCVESADYNFEAVAFSRLSINLDFGEENMNPEKATMARRNAGISPSTTKIKKWYQ